MHSVYNASAAKMHSLSRQPRAAKGGSGIRGWIVEARWFVRRLRLLMCRCASGRAESAKYQPSMDHPLTGCGALSS